MKRPNFQPIFEKKSEFCEKSSAKPVDTFIPGQAITLKELVTRFERGQRLNVHANFAPGSNLEQVTDEEAMQRIKSENMDSDDFPATGIYDIADVEAAKREHDAHKADFQRRMKEKKEAAQQAKQKQAQQAADPQNPAPPVA